MKVEGSNGQIELFDDRMVISRKGFLAMMTQGLKGDKSIPLSSIAAVQFKEAGFLQGYIQFSIKGGNESRGGVTTAHYDENTVTFYAGKNAEFADLRRLIEDRVAALSSRAAPGAAISVADEIKKFADLRDAEVLTDEEFQQKKRQLLGA